MSSSSSTQDDFRDLENEDFNSSGCGDMSFEISGDNPEHFSVLSPPQSRRMNYSRCDNNIRTPAPTKLSFSPPYKRVRALRLFDSPLTPKTIIQKSSSAVSPLPRSRLFDGKPKAVPSAYAEKEKPAANVNPFTPDGLLMSKKRSRSLRSLDSPKFKPPKSDLNESDDASDQEIEQPIKRIALQESNIPRYHREFVELELIGKGQFGSVFKCVNRLDGCIYAIKKSIKPVAGSAFEKTALNEVYAHAVLGKHQHVVRYYSAWAEDNHMIIQNEYCNGGSLADKIVKEPLSAAELRRMLLHVAEGLRYIHSEGLVHLDIKPGNIFISIEKKVNLTNYDSADDGFEELDDSQMFEEELTYKIGDLGHVTSLSKPQVEEGDCRYLPNEILHEDYGHLTKADVFAVGLSALECAGAGPLPKNGPKWHSIREGHVPSLPQKLTKDLLELISIPANEEKRNIWFALLGFEKGKLLPKRPYICSDHFVKDDFEYKSNGQKYLKRDARPQPVHTEVFQQSSSNIGSDNNMGIGLPISPPQGTSSSDKTNDDETNSIKFCGVCPSPDRSMIHPDPTQRPSTIQILQHRALNPDCTKSKADLTRELNAEKLRNEMLVKQLKEAAMCIKTIQNSRLIGKKVNRSVSTTTF